MIGLCPVLLLVVVLAQGFALTTAKLSFTALPEQKIKIYRTNQKLTPNVGEAMFSRRNLFRALAGMAGLSAVPKIAAAENPFSDKHAALIGQAINSGVMDGPSAIDLLPISARVRASLIEYDRDKAAGLDVTERSQPIIYAPKGHTIEWFDFIEIRGNSYCIMVTRAVK